MSHILLDGSLAHVNTQFQEFSTNALSTPQSILCCHLPDQSDDLCSYLRRMRSSLGPALPDQAKELTMEASAVYLVEL